ncbi:MAG: hypothetical protein GWO16_02180 [Gammaproteobacteria bacterium]|nr:hypothetical protein [Gammaproteobacteria bacterium]NIR96965.1 hypothetical protein [Gammaproteobacteria bacterium]NIT62667.1 hypothetical protein [Gammaproteobacteria bacterium]NIV19627.1 hypothetical protein [Gammaproteobacteria bacterium]NIX10847.1 hypothetical protein [Gammaproteobacteria bacterium]
MDRARTDHEPRTDAAPSGHRSLDAARCRPHAAARQFVTGTASLVAHFVRGIGAAGRGDMAAVGDLGDRVAAVSSLLADIENSTYQKRKPL